jgi:hypothetical protein
MCTHIAEEQAQLEAIDQKPPDWTAGKKKRTLNRSSKQREETRKGQDRGVARARLTTLSSCATKLLSPPLRLLAFLWSARPLGFCRQPTFRNPLCWLNVGGQMVVDPHERALKSFSAE